MVSARPLPFPSPLVSPALLDHISGYIWFCLFRKLAEMASGLWTWDETQGAKSLLTLATSLLFTAFLGKCRGSHRSSCLCPTPADEGFGIFLPDTWMTGVPRGNLGVGFTVSETPDPQKASMLGVGSSGVAILELSIVFIIQFVFSK